jgi:hypothetical protein
LSDVESAADVESPPPEEDQPEPLVAHAKVVDDAGRTDPGECSGDDEKTYGRDEELWLRLRFGSVMSADAPQPQRRARTFTEFVPGRGAEDEEDEEDESPSSSPQNQPEPSPADDEDDYENAERAARVAILSTHKGREETALCVPCSQYVVRAFDALWTPVGPRHRQILQSTARWNGWVEKLSGGTFGSKWQRRYFRITDKGLHYFETDKTTEKPKGFKMFTQTTRIITELPVAQYPKCNDNRFYHCALTVNEKDETFFLRTATEKERKELLDFLRDALERLRLSMVGQDPNPGRWRARVKGLLQCSKALRTETDGIVYRERKSRQQRDRLREEVRIEQEESDFLRLQAHDLEEQEERLVAMLEEAKNEAEDEAERCAQRVAVAGAARQRVIEAQMAIRKEIEDTKANTAKLRMEVQQLQCMIVDKTEERRVAEEEHRKMISKWRHAEERAPQTSVRRARRQTGLGYKPLTPDTNKPVA